MSKKSAALRPTRRSRAVDPPPAPDAPAADPAPPADNPWGADAAHLPHAGGTVIAAPGTDPAHLARLLDEDDRARETHEEQMHAWRQLGDQLAVRGSDRVELAMRVAWAIRDAGAP